MKQSNSKHKFATTDLTAALDKSVEAASDLGLSQTDLVRLLLERCRPQTSGKVVRLKVDVHHHLFDPFAGP